MPFPHAKIKHGNTSRVEPQREFQRDHGTVYQQQFQDSRGMKTTTFAFLPYPDRSVQYRFAGISFSGPAGSLATSLNHGLPLSHPVGDLASTAGNVPNGI
jgi:hypothetical protein